MIPFIHSFILLAYHMYPVLCFFRENSGGAEAVYVASTPRYVLPIK